jgi:hypothetical protein
MTYIEFGGQSSVRKLVNSILVYALGDTVAALNIRHQSECLAKNKHQNLHTYYWQQDPTTKTFHCYKTSTYLRPAVSPAFEIESKLKCYDLQLL